MSGIYIENAKLPEQGDELIIFEDGSVWTTMRPTRGYFRIDGAIAVEVPDHGRLIDADAFENRNAYFWNLDFINPKYPDTLANLVNSAPTIIPANK